MFNINRRRFLQCTAVAGASLLAVQSGRAQPGASPPLRIRQSALKLAPTHQVFKDYAEAVKKMHALPTSDRRNWHRQAEIHTEFCTHETIDFLPWHRHYITQFEKICGSLIGKPNFSLPYWDWSFGEGKIPDAFFDIQELNVEFWNDNGDYAGGTNWPEFHTIGIRAIGKGTGVQSQSGGGAFTTNKINAILGETVFDDFTTRLEREPHNTGHIVVGTPNGHIGDGFSPLDPLFWLHHCNVDRLWARWQMGGNATPNFTGNYNANFVDAGGNPVNVTANETKDFRAMGFSYDEFGDPLKLLVAANVISSQEAFLEKFNTASIQNKATKIGELNEIGKAKIDQVQSFEIAVANLKAELQKTRTQKSLDFPDWTLTKGNWKTEELNEISRPKETPRRIQAVLTNIKTTSKRSPIVNVFINCPYLSTATPHTDGHYAGTFAFFGAAHPAKNHNHGEGHKAGSKVIVDLAKPLQELGLSKTDKIKLQLVPIGGDKGSEVSFDKIEIIST